MCLGQAVRPGLDRFLRYKDIVETVGMWKARGVCGVSKDGGKGGNPAVGFPSFPHSSISTGLQLFAGRPPFHPQILLQSRFLECVRLTALPFLRKTQGTPQQPAVQEGLRCHPVLP